MKFILFIKRTFLVFILFAGISAQAQQQWGSFFTTIDANNFHGKKFKLQADIKAEVIEDSASARLWVRVDNQTRPTFFDDMPYAPVREKNWKTYTIEGKIDSSAERIVLGVQLELNGRFYYDNIRLLIEKGKNKWQTIYSSDFEKGLAGWIPGIDSKRTIGINELYTSSAVKDAQKNKNVWLIEGTKIPDYGNSKKNGKFADVNGIKLYYEIFGEGPPLLVLHGNGGSIANASDFYPELIKKYKIIAIDSRAQGRSTDTDQPLTYDQMASDINELLNQLKIDSVYIWGQSDGAILAILMAKDHPEKVKKALAFAPNMQPDSTALHGWVVRGINKTIATSKNPREKKLNVMMRDYPNVSFSDLEKVQAPCLIMGGDRDMIELEHLVKIFQHIPNSQLCILPGATHGASWEQQERFLSILNDFFLSPFSMPGSKDWSE